MLKHHPQLWSSSVAQYPLWTALLCTWYAQLTGAMGCVEVVWRSQCFSQLWPTWRLSLVRFKCKVCVATECYMLASRKAVCFSERWKHIIGCKSAVFYPECNSRSFNGLQHLLSMCCEPYHRLRSSSSPRRSKGHLRSHSSTGKEVWNLEGDSTLKEMPGPIRQEW